ncbi:cupin domain-containing protein [Pseudalkalibacillus decolorationis]|uniref:cupin domain-containing protein n=1 Tax=Pseudalkalibacillus decolorationis TaxID=163879 RepID=UPI002148B535|nr:cupin domain-containing protein [Pseudalkalibacillus decolorationis]
MKIYRFDQEVGKHITQFDSSFIMSRVVAADEPAHIGCMHIKAEGIVGYHKAVSDQLFLVVAGEGWVRGEEDEKTKIKTGEVAFWEDGEWHESGTDTGMTAIVIESTNLDPSIFMPDKDDQ